MSSAAAVAYIKRLTGLKCGHAGTLDPEVAGVLPVMVGRATRLQDYFTDKSKAYVGEICFTGATDTQDAQGTLVEPGCGAPEEAALKAVIRERFTGDILQVPPMYSAVKLQGRPLYALARAGGTAQIPARPTRIDRCEVLNRVDPWSWRIAVSCGGGTYIRTLFHDIGQALGHPAHMRTLIRVRSGCFQLDSSVTVEQLAAVPDWRACLIPMDATLMDYACIALTERQSVQMRNGVPIPAEPFGLQPGQTVRVIVDGWFFGLARCERDDVKMFFLAEV